MCWRRGEGPCSFAQFFRLEGKFFRKPEYRRRTSKSTEPSRGIGFAPESWHTRVNPPRVVFCSRLARKYRESNIANPPNVAEVWIIDQREAPEGVDWRLSEPGRNLCMLWKRIVDSIDLFGTLIARQPS